MLKVNNIFKSVAILALCASAFVSCLQEQEHQVEAVGYLSLPRLDVDVTVQNMTQTKAAAPVVEAPSTADIHFVVKDKDGAVKYDADGLWSDGLVLPVGEYTVTATYGSNGFGAPFFSGTTSGTIEAFDQEVPVLNIVLANSLVCVELDAEFAKHFNATGKVALASGSLTSEAEYGAWCYVPSGSNLVATLKGTNSAGIDASFTHTLTAPSAKVAYNVVCKPSSTSWPSITMSAVDAANVWASRAFISAATFSNISAENQSAAVYEAIPSSSSDWSSPIKAVTENSVLVLKGLTMGTEYKVRARVGALTSNEVTFTPAIDGLSVSAAHTYSSGELDGTDVTTSFSKSDLVKNAISSWTVNVCKEDGTVLRSHTALGFSDGSTFTGTTDWPYLPTGNYKVTFSATMSDGEVITSEGLSFSTAAPTFSVTAAGKTTYDYAQARDLNNANAVSGSHTAGASIPSQSLFEVGSTVSISSNLMDNTNYSKTVYYAALKDGSVVIATDGYIDYGTAKTHYLGDVHNAFTDWRSYQLSAKVNFAGTEYEGTKTFHITGLPYSLLSDNVHKESWNLSGGTAEWNGSVVHLNHSYENYATLTFYMVDTRSVSLQTSFRIYTPSLLGKPKLTINSGGSDLESVEGGRGTAVTNSYDRTYSGSLNASNSSIKFTRSYKYNREGDVWIDKLVVTYL